jgi:glycosyltransferase involved in cell wall biosynthesis
MSNLGHNVILIVPDKNSTISIEKDVFNMYAVEDSFRIECLGWPKIRGKSLVFAYNVARKVIDIKPDIVYSRFIYGGLLSSLIGFTTIYEAHQSDWETGITHRISIEGMNISGCLHKMITISNTLKKDMAKHTYVETDGIKVAHDAAYGPRNIKLSVEKEPRHVGYVGSLYDGKGVSIVTKIAKEMNSIKFHIVGGNKKNINKWKEFYNGKNIKYHGYVAKKEVDNYIKKMDICLLPNQKKVDTYGERKQDIGKYTSPLKLFEYMSYGKPIIASNIRVIREVLSHGENALLCSHDRPYEWVRSINKLIQNYELRRRIAMNAKREFDSEYTWNARAKKVMPDEYSNN